MKNQIHLSQDDIDFVKFLVKQSIDNLHNMDIDDMDRILSNALYLIGIFSEVNHFSTKDKS